MSQGYHSWWERRHSFQLSFLDEQSDDVFLEFLHFSVHTPQHLHIYAYRYVILHHDKYIYIFGPLQISQTKICSTATSFSPTNSYFFSNLSPPAMPSTAGPGWRQLGHPHRLALRLPAQHDVHGRMSMWPAGVQSLRNHQSPGAGDSHVGKNTQREGSRFKCRSLFVTMTGWLISYIIDLNRYIICIYMLHHM